MGSVFNSPFLEVGHHIYSLVLDLCSPLVVTFLLVFLEFGLSGYLLHYYYNLQFLLEYYLDLSTAGFLYRTAILVIWAGELHNSNKAFWLLTMHLIIIDP